jgi:hypothetical protein
MVTMTRVSSIPLPGLQPCGLAWDGEAWWNADGMTHRVYRLDPEDGAIRREFDVPGATGGTAWGEGAVWQTIPARNVLLRLDPHDGQVLDEIVLGISVVGVTWVAPRRLILSGHYEQALFRLELETGHLEQELRTPERPGHVAWDGAALWVSGAPENATIYRLEPGTGRVLRVVERWGDIRGLDWDGHRLWWVESGDRRAYPVD